MNTFIQELSKYLDYVRENEKEVVFRCPLHKDRRGHLYVEKISLKYICFKCGVKGRNIIKFILNHFNNVDSNILMTLLQNNNTSIPDSEHNKTVNLQEHLQLIELLRQLNDMELLRTYLKVIRKITDKNYIEYFLSDVLFYIPSLTSQLVEVIAKLYNIKNPPPGIYINLSQLNSNGIQIRSIQNKQRYLTLSDNSPVYIHRGHPMTLFIVEGVFDLIKLDYLIHKEITNYSILSLMGKSNLKSISSYFDIVKTIRTQYILLDQDVQNEELNEVTDRLSLYIPKKYIFIRKFKTNSIKDLDTIKNLQEFRQSIEFIQSPLFKIEKLVYFVNS